jgi:hypothetical protein
MMRAMSAAFSPMLVSTVAAMWRVVRTFVTRSARATTPQTRMAILVWRLR